MSEVIQSELVLSESSFCHTMTDEDYKNHVKKQLAYALAEKLLETNRATFTYTKNSNDFTVKVIGRVVV
jgi:hypothetical protein